MCMCNTDQKEHLIIDITDTIIYYYYPCTS